MLSLWIFVAISPISALADFSSIYRFEDSLDDDSGVYAPSVGGDATYVADNDSQVLNMVGNTYLAFPIQTSQNIDTSKSFYLSVDFMLPEEGVDESYRVIAANKGWNWDEPGFRIIAYNEKTEWQPEGTYFVDFNIGIGDTEIYKRYYGNNMGEWKNASIYVDFENGLVSFGLDGRLFEQSLYENIVDTPIDPSPFIDTLNTKQIRIGVHGPHHGQDFPWVHTWGVENDNNNISLHTAAMRIDNLAISSPRPPGDSHKVIDALARFSDHLNSVETLDDDTAVTVLRQLRDNLIGTDLADIAPELIAYLNLHALQAGPLYDGDPNFYSRYSEFAPSAKAYVDLGIWLMQTGLASENANLVEGLKIKERESFPGTVPEGAERVSNAVANVRAQYVTDPYYRMGDMKVNPNNELASFVYRPTGYYAPAGELITVTVDPAVVDTGVHVRVGAHRENHILLASTNRFPLISVNYRVEASTFQIVNPIGGPIHVLVPQGVDLGWIDVELDGAIRSPYFSTRSGRETPVEDWETIRQYPGVFAELESDKYVVTVLAEDLRDFDEPTLLLERWDRAMDLLQILHGRPLERSRAEGFLYDSATATEGSFPGGYPVTPGSWSRRNDDIEHGYFSPFAILRDGHWEEDGGFSALIHEMTHHHLGRFVEDGGQEVYVNLPMAAILQDIHGLSYDEALAYSGYQEFTRDDAAIDWMVTHNFRSGNEMGWDPTTDYQPIETSYQTRAHAKYVDLAAIHGGWNAVGDIYKAYYEQDKAKGVPVEYDVQFRVTSDDFLLTGSEALGYNLASLFHFWGTQPSETAAEQLASYPPLPGALERILNYMDIAPRTNEELRAFREEKLEVHENQLKFQIWDPLILVYDQSYGQSIRDQGAHVLKTYFDVDPDAPPSKPVLETSEFDLDADPNSTVSFAWTPSADPEGHPLKYSWKLYNLDTKEVILSRTWLETNQVELSVADLSTALEPYENSETPVELAQTVTTSDPFTVVTSDALVSTFYENRAFSIQDVPNGDPDGDLLSNGFELLFGYDPYVRNTYSIEFKIARDERSDNYRIQYYTPEIDSESPYSVAIETSTDLSNWSRRETLITAGLDQQSIIEIDELQLLAEEPTFIRLALTPK